MYTFLRLGMKNVSKTTETVVERFGKSSPCLLQKVILWMPSALYFLSQPE
jgi:hypothetical protein